MTTVLLLWLLLNQSVPNRINQHILKRHKLILVTSIVLLLAQIFLGGWTSTNYAALSCGEYFPTCLGELWPDNMDFKNAFFWGPLGIDYEFGVLESQTRNAIQMLHRLGALVVTMALAFLIISFGDYECCFIFAYACSRFAQCRCSRSFVELDWSVTQNS